MGYKSNSWQWCSRLKGQWPQQWLMMWMSILAVFQDQAAKRHLWHLSGHGALPPLLPHPISKWRQRRVSEGREGEPPPPPYTGFHRGLNRSAETCWLTLCTKNTGRRRLWRSQESGTLTCREVQIGFSEEAMLELRSVGRCSKEHFKQREELVQRLHGGREHGDCEELRRQVGLEWRMR